MTGDPDTAPLDALCIGHAAWDLTVRMPGMPQADAKYEIDALGESGGGPAANAAHVLSRWGARTALAAVVGDDHWARRMRDEDAAAGVDHRLVEHRAGHATPLSLILVDAASGSRTIINRKLPTAPLAADPDAFALAPRLILADGHEPDAALAWIAAHPRAITVLDAGSPRPGVLALAGRVRHLVCSERHAAAVTGLPPGDPACLAWLRLVSAGTSPGYPATVAITCGAHGVHWDDGAGPRHLPAFPAHAVDTTAAGDIFHGAFAWALLDGRGYPDALRLAAAAAAVSVERHGGRASIPTLREAEERLSHGV